MSERCEFDGGRLRDHDCEGDAPYVVTYSGVGYRDAPWGPLSFAACIVIARQVERQLRRGPFERIDVTVTANV